MENERAGRRHKVGNYGLGTRDSRFINEGLTPEIRSFIDLIMQREELSTLRAFAARFGLKGQKVSQLRFGKAGISSQEKWHREFSDYLRKIDHDAWLKATGKSQDKRREKIRESLIKGGWYCE